MAPTIMAPLCHLCPCFAPPAYLTSCTSPRAPHLMCLTSCASPHAPHLVHLTSCTSLHVQEIIFSLSSSLQDTGGEAGAWPGPAGVGGVQQQKQHSPSRHKGSLSDGGVGSSGQAGNSQPQASSSSGGGGGSSSRAGGSGGGGSSSRVGGGGGLEVPRLDNPLVGQLAIRK